MFGSKRRRRPAAAAAADSPQGEGDRDQQQHNVPEAGDRHRPPSYTQIHSQPSGSAPVPQVPPQQRASAPTNALPVGVVTQPTPPPPPIIENIPADIVAAQLQVQQQQQQRQQALVPSGRRNRNTHHTSTARTGAANAMSPPAQILHPPSGVQAGETGGSNMSDLTDELVAPRHASSAAAVHNHPANAATAATATANNNGTSNANANANANANTGAAVAAVALLRNRSRNSPPEPSGGVADLSVPSDDNGSSNHNHNHNDNSGGGGQGGIIGSILRQTSGNNGGGGGGRGGGGGLTSRLFRGSSGGGGNGRGGGQPQHQHQHHQQQGRSAAGSHLVLHAECQVAGTSASGGAHSIEDGPAAVAAASSSAMGHPRQRAIASSSTMQQRQQPPQPDLMDDDDSAEEANLQRQLSLGMGPHQGGLVGGHHHGYPHPAPMMGGPHHHHPNSSLGGMPVMEHMPTDVGELLRRANSQSVNPPPLATALRNSASRSGAAAAGGGSSSGIGNGNGNGNGTGTSAYGASTPGATSRLDLTNGAATGAAAAAADQAAAEESEFGQVSHGPLRDFHPASTQRISSSSTAGGSSLPSSMQTSDPNMAAVPNPPTPTGEIEGGSGGGGGGSGGGAAAAAAAMARSRSIGAPPTSSSSHFPSPLGRPGSLRRNATDESAHRLHSAGPGGRQSSSKSTVTFTDDVPDGDDKMKASEAASAVSGDGIANNASDIHTMSREEKDRLLRELLLAQESGSSQQQPQSETGTTAQQSNDAAASASVPAPSRAAAPGEARAAGGGTNSADGSVDSTVAEMIRRQEEAALRLSLAETRGNVASGSEAARAAESARAAMEESDDQMLNRALEISRTETTARRPDAAEAQAGNDDMDDELQRVLELSRNDVGGRQQTGDEDEDEEEMMKRALNISLQDTGGRQYIRGGPRSSAVYAPPPNVARGTSMGEGGIPRQTSVGNRTGGRVTVSGAGIEAVNGIYTLSGTCNSVNMYSQKGQWDGKDVMFTLYRCFLDPEAGVEGDLGTPRLWFISIVPPDVKPGTDEDKDFYVARGSEDVSVIPTESPPESGWAPVEPFGQGNPPSCKWEPPPMLQGVTEEALVAAPRIPEIQVYAAGSEQVNGTYEPVGEAPVTVYVNNITWKGEELRIFIFRSQDDDDESGSDAGKQWFLSIVPEGCSPGSSVDTDLYVTTERTGDERITKDGKYILPPSEGWKTVRGFGIEPPPVCLTEIEDEPLQCAAHGAPGNNLTSSAVGAETAAAANGRVPDTVDQQLKEKSSSSSGLTDSASRNTPHVRVADQNNEIRTRKIAMCVVCKTKKVTHILVPCGHPCLCEDCADYGELEAMDWHCPVGRCKIERVMRFFGTLVEEA